VRPVGNYLGRINEQIEEQKRILPKKLQILNYKDKVLKEYQQLKEFMTDQNLSEEEEIAQLLREIERVSKKSNLFVQNINPVKRNNVSTDIYELTVDIEGGGKIEQVITFMQELETENPPIRIRDFTLSPKAKDSEELKFLFTIVKLGVREQGDVMATKEGEIVGTKEVKETVEAGT
jgi:intergrase/recombinase